MYWGKLDITSDNEHLPSTQTFYGSRTTTVFRTYLWGQESFAFASTSFLAQLCSKPG